MGIQERRLRDRERRRQQILVAAKRVFSSWGYNRATMEEIAKEAELSPGTLYLYFKNKDELYASLTLRVLQFLFIRLDHIHKDQSLEPSRYIDAIQQALNDVYEFDPASLKNMFCIQSSEILKNISPELLEQIDTLTQNSLGLMADIFERGIDASRYENRSPQSLAVITWALFSGVILWEEYKKIVNDNFDSRQQTLATAFKIFANGIEYPPLQPFPEGTTSVDMQPGPRA